MRDETPADLEWPQVQDEQLPASLAGHVSTLESKGVDTRFHRFIAHSTKAADFYWRDFYEQLFFAGRLPRRSKEIVRLTLAGVSGCQFCRANDIDSALAAGVDREDVDAALALDFDALPGADAAVARLAHRLTPFHDRGPLPVGEWQELRDHFDDEEMAELLICASVLAGVGRMLSVTGFIPDVCDVQLGP